MAEIRRARNLDPRSLPILVGEGGCLYFERRYEEALRVYGEAANLDSTSGLPYRAMAGCYYQLGRKAETGEAIRRWLENQYSHEASARASRAYRAGGLRGMARTLVSDMERQRAAGLPGPATHLAELSIIAGDLEAAIRWLEVAFREHDTELNRLKVDPHFDPLREDPRFQALLHRVGLGPEPLAGPGAGAS
jgi:tetratricopeptide (TPR) repeat protein